jgi:hypothetical protein
MMGLQAPIEYQGLHSEKGYWRLSELHWSIDEPLTVRLGLNGYASQEAFQDGKAPIQTLPYVVEVDPEHPDNAKVKILVTIRNLGYLEAKTIPQMEGALDV